MAVVYPIIAESKLWGLKASWEKKVLEFKQPSGTSRGILKQKNTWILKVWLERDSSIVGLGECGPLVGLSIDDLDSAVFELKLNTICLNIDDYKDLLERALEEYPSIRFGLEMALLDLINGGERIIFSSNFVQNKVGININGLIWMGEECFMKTQIEEKLVAGFNCIKMKIGAIDFETEIKILEGIRSRYDKSEIELRVDANGAFGADALEKLKRLSKYELHSIEQPVMAGQVDVMHELCHESPLSIALDEELIGVRTYEDKKCLLETIQPQYIILKPTLLGGFQASMEWINIAESLNIAWWITSALESNIGLNAIAQWTYTLNNDLPQGLGTGGLFKNNFPSPLRIIKGYLYYDKTLKWIV